MRVSKELIEKYHNGLCTPDEMTLVENWLLDDEADDFVPLQDIFDRKIAKVEMWEEISAILPSSQKRFNFGGIYLSKAKWTNLATAASVLVVLTASLFVFKQNTQQAIITSVNNSLSDNKEIDARDYTISLGPESNARIDANSGLIDFCGTILISPKKDIFLSFKDVCTTSASNTGKMTFKKGETYIALNYRNKKNNEVIVMEEKLLMGLPPVVKRQIMDQFNI
ncbi:hypothetical protein [Dyadobacter sp. LHD-138]|uniref:hypothetical protein n=1 Tax=Dyadobacter sp. LHD-138 TaxID=3071413 RepID=UPI0027E11FBC|nr:hypothetical protein [Dyadobacter sp. LHD-138]MDQ6480027.1 hypothetical protein [Dyadobacter sp. LHD-138]